MNSQNNHLSEVEDFLITYLNAYFVERDFNKATALLGNNIVGFGTGVDETAENRGDFTQLYARDIEQIPNTINYNIHKIFTTHIAPDVYSANATLSINTIVQEQEFSFNSIRLSIIVVRKEKNFSIEHMHISLPTVEHEEGESYPIKELEERNVVLQKLVDKQTAELKQALYEINVLASTDKLTGINNRHLLDEKLNEELKRSSRYGNHLSLILLDIDHFKTINDACGHLAGDRILKTIADLIQACLRNTDTVGRWGGDEFLVICPETNLEQAQSLAEKIRIHIEQCVFSTQHTHTASIGVSSYQANDTYDSLFHRADKAIYHSKANGRNRVTTQPF